MSPVVVDGVLRPDLDFRDVPPAVMAKYLGIAVCTLYRRTISGFYVKGIRRVGSIHYYQPRALVGEGPK
jgi:hypothetical protein